MSDPKPDSVAVIVSQIRRKLRYRKRPLLVAVDGRSGAGKSTLAAAVAVRVHATVVDGDDFYSGGTEPEWDARSAAENADRCIDWRRLRAQALEPLLSGRSARWHPFDWENGDGLAEQMVVAQPSSVLILDGAYSFRHDLSDLVGLSVLVDVPEAVRHERLLRREGFLSSWDARWDEAEQHYFTLLRPPSAFDLVVGT